MNHDTTPELIISAAASKSTWAGVVSMFFGWLVSSNAAIVVGMLVGVAGVVVAIGIDKEMRLDFGSTGLAATTLGTNTTVVCPVYTGVIWRVTVGYRLGL